MKYLTVILLAINAVCICAATSYAQQLTNTDIEQLESIIGIKGETSEGVYKVTVPQNDLNVEVDGFEIVPPMGLGSWVAFSKSPDGIMIMGDLVVKEDEIMPVQKVVIENNLTLTGLHNHFVREDPSVMYMHIGGSGDLKTVAGSVRQIFEKIESLRNGDPSSASSNSVNNKLDVEKINRIIGHEGSMDKGVYKITIGRPDVNLVSMDTEVSSFMGFNTWAAWQGTPDKAAVAGDFAMLEDEVDRVIKALVSHGIEVVAVHNHMIHEEPRIFFLHYWGVGQAEKLAQGLKAALNETGIGKTN